MRVIGVEEYTVFFDTVKLNPLWMLEPKWLEPKCLEPKWLIYIYIYIYIHREREKEIFMSTSKGRSFLCRVIPIPVKCS